MTYVGDTISKVQGLAGTDRLVVISDHTVKKLHGDKFPDADVILIGQGEDIKTLDTVEEVYRYLIELEADKGTFLIGIGGGLVCDVTGFVATTFKRGLPFGLMPTTLLAQVDAAIGGKNGVNLLGYKNMVGTVTQPRFVLSDPTFLTTLPNKEISNGMAETIKTAALGDAKLFKMLAKIIDVNDTKTMTEVIKRCAKFKTSVVAKDDMDAGLRMQLNFGHTIGHGLELTKGLGHGEAVAIGMVMESKLMGVDAKVVTQLEDTLASYNLPTTIKFDKRKLMASMTNDKKRMDDIMTLPKLEAIGKVKLIEMSMRQMEAGLRDLS